MSLGNKMSQNDQRPFSAVDKKDIAVSTLRRQRESKLFPGLCHGWLRCSKGLGEIHLDVGTTDFGTTSKSKHLD